MTLNDFVSCDWGTTSFRLRRVHGTQREVVQEIREPAGVRSLYEQAARGGGGNETSRAEVFSCFLRAKLDELITGETPQHALSLVISGMASSSVGWRELAYARTPFALDGSGLHSEEMKWNGPGWLATTYLLSGVATEHEMMRGEESEIIGLMADPNVAALRERCLLILPGTHSKHVWIKNSSVIDFRTFMTGELFEVLGRHSLLRASVDLDARVGESDSFSESARTAFREGVTWAKERGLAGGLFRVRTRAVLGRRPVAENTWFFSGLLVGAELAGIADNVDCPVILAATSALSQLYGMALEIVAAGKTNWIQLPADQVARATVLAHGLFLQKQLAK